MQRSSDDQETHDRVVARIGTETWQALSFSQNVMELEAELLAIGVEAAPEQPSSDTGQYLRDLAEGIARVRRRAGAGTLLLVDMVEN